MSTGIAEVQKETQIRRELSTLTEAIIRTDKEVANIGDRLADTLNMEEPPLKEEDSKEEIVVPLAAQIRSLRYSVERINNVLNSYIIRLEL